MKNINDVLKLNIDSFFKFVHKIDYGYMDADGLIHRITPADDYAKLNSSPYRFSSPKQVVENNCGWCWDVAELIRFYCEKNLLEYKCIFLEYLTNNFHKTHMQVFIKFNGKWCEAPDNTSPITFGENGYDKFGSCINDFANLFRAYLKHELGDKYNEKFLLVKEITKPMISGMTDKECLKIARSN